jgi:hypothetical protein
MGTRRRCGDAWRPESRGRRNRRHQLPRDSLHQLNANNIGSTGIKTLLKTDQCPGNGLISGHGGVGSDLQWPCKRPAIRRMTSQKPHSATVCRPPRPPLDPFCRSFVSRLQVQRLQFSLFSLEFPSSIPSLRCFLCAFGQPAVVHIIVLILPPHPSLPSHLQLYTVKSIHIFHTTVNMGTCDFLSGILTPNGLATCNRDPQVLLSTLFTILGLILMCVLVWYISFVTGKAYPPRPGTKKPTLAQKAKGLLGMN